MSCRPSATHYYNLLRPCALAHVRDVIVTQVGYTTGYGGHAVGFVLSMLAGTTMEGLLTIVVAKGLGVIASV